MSLPRSKSRSSPSPGTPRTSRRAESLTRSPAAQRKVRKKYFKDLQWSGLVRQSCSSEKDAKKYFKDLQWSGLGM